MKKNELLIASCLGVALSIVTTYFTKYLESETATVNERLGLELIAHSLSSNIEPGHTYKANVELRNSGKKTIFIVDPNRHTGPPIIKLDGELPYGSSDVEIIPIDDYILVELAPLQSISWKLDLSVNKDGKLKCLPGYQVYDLDDYQKDVCFELVVKWVDFASKSSGNEILLTNTVRVNFSNIVVDPRRAKATKKRLEEKPDIKGLPKI